MTPKILVAMCDAIAEGHYRRGIRPDMRLWHEDYKALAEMASKDTPPLTAEEAQAAINASSGVYDVQ